MILGRGKTVWLFLALAAGLAGNGSSAPAQLPPSAGTSAPREPKAPKAPSVTVGIQGHYRAGCWTAVRWRVAERRPADAGMSIETRDGDGVNVVYRQPTGQSATPNALRGRGYAIPGSEAAPLVLRDGPDVLMATRFPERGAPERGPAMIPLDMPWIVAMGDPMGIDTIGVNELLDRGASVAVSTPRQPAALPDAQIGYDGVDLLVINHSGRELLAGLSEKQAAAIVDWVHSGGELLITLGESAPELFQSAPWLDSLLPISSQELIITEMNPSGLETFTSSTTRLEPFVAVKLPREIGRTLVTGRTARRVSTPLAARYHAGLGRVTAIAADLDKPPLAVWPERLDLIRQLNGSVLEPEQRQRPLAARRATGFNDLAGQMRAALDRFDVKRSIPFSIISLIVLGWVAVIGPLDYWVLNRMLGRPLFGWLTFPAAALGLSVLLIFQARPATPAVRTDQGKDRPGEDIEAPTALQYNRVEVIDIDSVEQVGRGFGWTQVYSHPARRLDVRVVAGEASSRVGEQIGAMLTAPMGYPGTSFGGIEIAGAEARLPRYEVMMKADRGLRTTIHRLPLAPRSSKSLSTHYRFEPNLVDQVVVSRRAGSELLDGEFSNPLPVDLLRGMLIYRNWVYLLPTRFPAGGRIESVGSLRQKNFRWQLTRQTALEESTESEAWDPTRYDSPARIAEMLMFHEAAGGTRYTGLRHQPLSFLDLSKLLSNDRCILVGRLAEPMTDVEMTISSGGGRSIAGRASAGESLSLVRVVLPVKTSDSR